jgi:flagellar hook-length control protein FliK
VKSVPTMARTSDGIAVAEPGDGQAGSGARALTDRPVPEVVRASAQETHRERPGPALTGAAAAYAPAAAVLHEARETVTVRAASRTPLSEQVAHAIARAVDDGQTQVAVRLEPPLLGTVRVTITMSDSGDVSAQLNASTELGRRVLDTGLPRLAAALADRGVDVGQLNVSVGGHESPSHFFDHSPGWQQPARAVWTPPAGIGLTGDGDPAEPIGPAWYGHHLIDLLA